MLVEDQAAHNEDAKGLNLPTGVSLCKTKIGDLQFILKKRDRLPHDIGEQAAAIIAGIIGSVGVSTILIWSII